MTTDLTKRLRDLIDDAGLDDRTVHVQHEPCGPGRRLEDARLTGRLEHSIPASLVSRSAATDTRITHGNDLAPRRDNRGDDRGPHHDDARDGRPHAHAAPGRSAGLRRGEVTHARRLGAPPTLTSAARETGESPTSWSQC